MNGYRRLKGLEWMDVYVGRVFFLLAFFLSLFSLFLQHRFSCIASASTVFRFRSVELCCALCACYAGTDGRRAAPPLSSSPLFLHRLHIYLAFTGGYTYTGLG